MAVYKVPQDVEAEDKLVGPLSFRQFIYAGIALGGVTVGVFMFQIFPLLAFIPLPVVLLFGALALPLRKDQPMETYLLALLRFYLKSKQRVWNPDGTITYVEITAPREIEQHLTKDFSGQTAQERLDYLARVMDTRGWALKGAVEAQGSINADVTAEVQTANDIMDEDANLSRSIDNLIAQKDQERKTAAREQMAAAAAAPPPTQAANTAGTADQQTQPRQTVHVPSRSGDEGSSPLHYNPYPTSIHQKVVHTMGEQKAAEDALAAARAAAKPTTPAPSAVPTQVSPGIMNLVQSGKNLSITAIANEAHRLEDKEEVVINLH
jgi:hypothetical protein